MEIAKRLPIAPLLLSAYAVLALLANNIDQISASQALRSVALSLTAVTILVVAFKLVLADWHRAALAAFLIVLLFFTYGHVYGFLKQVQIFSLLIGRHRFLIPVWIGLLVLGFYLISKRVKDTAPIIGILNLIAGILIVIPLLTIVIFAARTRSIQPLAEIQSVGNCDLTAHESSPVPDIYYLILDAYGREDDLNRVYNFDNSPFLEDLREMGFFIADGSQSNYVFTHLSTTSTLNMDYLQSLDDRIYAGAPYNVAHFWPLLGENIVRRNLECIGYKVISFDSGWHALGWRDADVYLSPESTSFAEVLKLSGGVNAFESMLLHSSAALILTDTATLMPKFFQIDTGGPFDEHRQRMLYELDALESVVPEIEGPKFVFAHILATHTPYLFGPDGGPIERQGQFTLADVVDGDDSDLEKAQYIDQIKFVNSRIRDAVREILRVSEIPPIIIIQSDHGYVDGTERSLNILNAYFITDDGSRLLYSTLSPVNTFRIIFNQYLGGDYSLLDDISYSSSYESYDFKIVPNEQSEN